MAELKDKFGEKNVDAELVGGSNGVFDVEIDGKRLFSKHESGRFPQYREIVNMIDEARLRQ